jgi:glycosyltransferase involved in cell wall biosynthesis
VREENTRILMRLAYLDPHPVPDVIPAALQILYTVDALGEIGVDVTLIVPEPRSGLAPRDVLGRPLSPRVTSHYLPDPRRRWWFPISSNQPFYFMAARRLRKLGADVALVRNLKMAEYLLRRPTGIPVVFETHELFAQTYREDHPRPSATQRRKLEALVQRERFVYSRCAALLALTPPLLEDIRKEYGVNTPAEIVPDGVDLKQAESPQIQPPNAHPILLYLGSLHPWKGVETLIAAMKYITRPARLAIVGGNEDRIAELRGLAERERVLERIVFNGPVEPGRRFEWIHRADVCLLPLTETSIGSRYTSPLKLFEYMAAGKPIVVSDLPSMRAILKEGEHAVFVPPADPRRLGLAIDQLLSDAPMRARIGNAARDLAAQYSWTERARTIVASVSRLHA